MQLVIKSNVKISVTTYIHATTNIHIKHRFTQTLMIWLVLLNTALCRSAFSTVSFRKQVFRLSVLSLNQDIKLRVIMLCNFDL